MPGCLIKLLVLVCPKGSGVHGITNFDPRDRSRAFNLYLKITCLESGYYQILVIQIDSNQYSFELIYAGATAVPKTVHVQFISNDL